ncbi:MAG: acyl-CoA dehydrogenase family protein [Paracoccaceae bacterium]
MDEEIIMIGEATARIMADLADPQTANAPDYDPGPLWNALVEAGLTRAWLPEDAGGAGLGLDGGFEVLRIAGQYACPVPLAETLLAGWALAAAGLEVPEGMLTLAPIRTRDRLDLGERVSGRARSVAYAGAAGHVVVVGADRLALIACDGCEVTPRPTDMGDERGDMVFDAVAPVAMVELTGAGAQVQQMGAVVRACQMTGALETALAITTEYAGEREAFGRKIGKFQAVQQSLAQLAGEVAAALTASGSAAATLATEAHDSDAAFLEIAAAKIRCGEAVEKGAAIAHQSMGAIGWTQEHTLQRFTRRMWGWRDDFGTEAEWAVRLGSEVANLGSQQLWPMITTR